MPRRLLASRLAAAIASSCSGSCSRVASGFLASTSTGATTEGSFWFARQAASTTILLRSFACCSSSSSPSPPPTPPPSTPTRPSSSSSPTAPPCWSCGNQFESTARPSLICGSCRAVQPLELVFGGGGGGGGEGKTSTSSSSSSSQSFPDPFSLLGLPRSFDVDPRALETSYRSLQAQLHPDRHHSRRHPSLSSAAERASAEVNAAVALLRCPLARARYLLDGARPDREEGEEEDARAGGERDSFDDPELLAEVMEAREEVEEAAEAAAAQRRRKSSNDGDGGDDDDNESKSAPPCPLSALRDKHERAAGDITRRLSEAFARDDLAEARRLAVRLRYATRILQAVTDKM